MTDVELEEYLLSLGLRIEAEQDRSGHLYIVVRNFAIPCGPLAGRTCDVALARCQTIPYVVPPAIHTRPALVRMDMTGPLKTQTSALGPDWQYWSRRFDQVPTPRAVWTHVLTVFNQVTP